MKSRTQLLQLCLCLALVTFSQAAHVRHSRAHHLARAREDNPFGKNSLCANDAANQQNVKPEFSQDQVFGVGTQRLYRTISDGPSSYVFDAFNDEFAQLVSDDMTAMWNSFKSASTVAEGDLWVSMDGTKVSQTDEPQANWSKMMVYDQIKSGSQKNEWPLYATEKDAKVVMSFVRKYSADGQFVSYKDFMRGAIDFFFKDTSDCKNCFEKSRKKALELFQFIDCYGWGQITSKMMLQSIFNLDIGTKMDSTDTNDFILKNGDMSKGIVTTNQFVKAILVGYWERLLGTDGIDDHYKPMMALRQGSA